MLLDDSRFPLVFLRAHEELGSSIDEQQERNSQLESLLDKQTPFVLIADHSTHDHDDETPEERKAKALFFKRIKDRIRKYCLGLIVIEGHSPANTAARIAAAAASKALGFSVQFAADEESAAAKGMVLLEKHAA
ncbi:hypothetical protein GR212_25570 [Rhizobium lusitanum]|uniref:Uncharacterized protein n=1 Tax=Rhizobium lusitanum TaxID=293958 RepID=A0A6L9UFI8_9HYPH|nr:hypothetical protein [Rhizobium lusitanum]NEI72936.1 hypothetical protein [Rhizobium lusitanum]